MPIKIENVGIAVHDLEAAIAFFTDLGLTVLGRDTVSGEWADTAVGLDGNHAKIAMLQTPDGNGRLELFEYLHPDAIETEPTRPNDIGMHRVAFSVTTSTRPSRSPRGTAPTRSEAWRRMGTCTGSPTSAAPAASSSCSLKNCRRVDAVDVARRVGTTSYWTGARDTSPRSRRVSPPAARRSKRRSSAAANETVLRGSHDLM